MITRRQFGKRSLTTVATLALASSFPLVLTGCSFDAKGLINTVIASVKAILRVAEATASWAASLQAALTALQQAEAAWEAGGAVVIIEDALDTIEAVVAVIPLTAPYAPLVAVLVAGIDAVLSYFTPAAAAAVRATKGGPYAGRVGLTKPRFLQTQVGAYKGQWNQQAKALGMKNAEI